MGMVRVVENLNLISFVKYRLQKYRQLGIKAIENLKFIQFKNVLDI
jgi:hypothetical protein